MTYHAKKNRAVPNVNMSLNQRRCCTAQYLGVTDILNEDRHSPVMHGRGFLAEMGTSMSSKSEPTTWLLDLVNSVLS